MPSSSRFTVRKSTAADISALVDIYLTAFEIDAISLLCFPRGNAGVRQWWEDMLLDELSDTSAYTLVVIAPPLAEGGQTQEREGKGATEEIVAFAKWNAPSDRLLDTTLPKWPQGCDIELADHFFGSLSKAQRRIMGDQRKHWYLELIATRPNWQGKGAAGKLMRWGLEKADENGERAYLEASPDGKPVYEHYGFEEVERLVVDLREKGSKVGLEGEKEFIECMMVRGPRVR